MTVEAFYDRLAPFYHLMFPDWEASIARQATALDCIIRERWGQDVRTVLDVACGIKKLAAEGLSAEDFVPHAERD